MNILTSLKKSSAFFDFCIIILGVITIFLLSRERDLLEAIVRFSHQYEHWELDEVITLSIFLTVALAVYSIRRWREIVRAKQVVEELNVDLQTTLAEIKVLKEILPICANCKKIRDDQGYWQQVESYISEHTNASFTHGICPDCMKTLYSEYYPS